jgi:hypothetical protein
MSNSIIEEFERGEGTGEDPHTVDSFVCRYCGYVLYADNTMMAPTERRGWVVCIPHFCCCGKCAWDCNHNHGALDSVCASNNVTHAVTLRALS